MKNIKPNNLFAQTQMEVCMSSLLSSSPKNPTELLDLQAQTLSRIYQVQLKQQELLEKIRAQQEKLLDMSASVSQQTSEAKPSFIKIVDFNMPFPALVSILVKIALASIPATLITGVVVSVLFFALLFILSLLGLGLNTLFGS